MEYLLEYFFEGLCGWSICWSIYFSDPFGWSIFWVLFLKEHAWRVVSRGIRAGGASDDVTQLSVLAEGYFAASGGGGKAELPSRAPLHNAWVLVMPERPPRDASIRLSLILVG